VQVFVKLECLLVVENLHIYVCCKGVLKPKDGDTEPGSGGENQPSMDSLAVPGSLSILCEALDSEQDLDNDPDFIPDNDESDSETSVVQIQIMPQMDLWSFRSCTASKRMMMDLIALLVLLVAAALLFGIAQVTLLLTALLGLLLTPRHLMVVHFMS
jgi:hypothetical protein